MSEPTERPHNSEQPELHSGTGQFEYHTDVFNASQLDAVTKVLPSDTRKIRWDQIDTGNEIPVEISTMRDALLQRFPFLRINVSIIKRYSPAKDSGAYQLHRDPEEFTNAPLVLVTLSGHAKLSVEVNDKIESVSCEPGTVVILTDPTLKHAITPPENESGVREFLFFGYSTNQK